eukprot:TRINITY_DN2482_c0_g1_i5.p1 TRINITY_DN2482_c0_g1~~TRINITY_DN2482_c0_g1_i5.p1  ORF type:complete len:625 (-),score=156.51 TRINITY_DN2482_c0_g1_i5:332-2206(-)
MEDDGSLLSLNDTSYSFSAWVPPNVDRFSPDRARSSTPENPKNTPKPPFNETMNSPNGFGATPNRLAKTADFSMASPGLGQSFEFDDENSNSPPKTAQALKNANQTLSRDNFNLKLRIFHLEERLSAGTGTGAPLEAEIVSLRVRLEQFARLLDARNRLLRRARDAVSAAELRGKEADSRVEMEKRENAIKSDEIANLNQKMAEMELKMAEMAKNAEKKALSSDFPREISLRDRLISAERAKSAQISAEISSKTAEISQKTAEISSQKAEISSQKAEISRKNAEIAEKTAEIAEKTAEISRLKREKTRENDIFSRENAEKTRENEEKMAKNAEKMEKRAEKMAKRAEKMEKTALENAKKLENLKRDASQAIRARNRIMGEFFEAISGKKSPNLFDPFAATPLLPDPFSIENSAFSYENSPNSAEKARFSAEKDGNSLSFWREKANFEAARVKKCENELASQTHVFASISAKFDAEFARISALFAAKIASLERKIAFSEGELGVLREKIAKRGARRSLGWENSPRKSPFSGENAPKMAENAPKMAENGENSQKKVHFSPEKAKNKSPQMRLEQRLSALAEHNRLLVLELEDRRNQQNLRERDFQRLSQRIRHTGGTLRSLAGATG